MGHLLRFLGLTILGSVGGIVLCHAMVHELSRTGEMQLAAAVLGAYFGIGVEMLIRLIIRRGWKFSIAEVLLATTLLAVVLAIILTLRTAMGR